MESSRTDGKKPHRRKEAAQMERSRTDGKMLCRWKDAALTSHGRIAILKIRTAVGSEQDDLRLQIQEYDRSCNFMGAPSGAPVVVGRG